MKKFISVFLLFLIIFSSSCALAKNQTLKAETINEFVSQKPVSSMGEENITFLNDNNHITLNEEAQSIPFEEYVYSLAKEQAETIDITSYRIAETEFTDIYLRFMFDYPDVFWFNDDYTVFTKYGYVTSFSPTYAVNKSERENFLTILNNKLEEYENLVKDEPDELKKYLLIHSKMIRECHYDYTFGVVSYTAYGFFVNQSATCQGYANALKLICDKVGLEARYCLNRQPNVNHIWNYIKINNKWYHTDTTWDDYNAPLTSDTYLDTNDQGSLHTYFLCSDRTYMSNGHGSKANYNTLGDEKPTCDDTTYESDEWIFNIKGSNGGSYLTDFVYEKDNLLLKLIGLFDSNNSPVKLISNNLSGNDIYSSVPCIMPNGVEYRFYAKNGYPKMSPRLVLSKEENITHIQSVPLLESNSGGIFKMPFSMENEKVQNADNFKLFMWDNVIPLTQTNSVSK